MDIRAVIFDMDGVLIDSEPLWVEAEIATFGRVGIQLDVEKCQLTKGLRIDGIVDYWHRRQPWHSPPVTEIIAWLRAEMVRQIEENGRALPGVDRAIEAVRVRGLRCALASSSSRDIIDAVMDRLGLQHVFDTLQSADDCAYGKPHPEVYLKAAASLGIETRCCVAVEDSLTGLISALAAGMITVAVPDETDRNDPRFVVAHHRIAGLDQLPDLLKRL